MTRNKGINLPLLTLFLFWGYDVSIINNNFNISVDRALDCIYKIDIDYSNVYIDYDDTLIIDGKVNCLLMQFLYQSINANKKIYLITKHNKEDIIKDIEKHFIDKHIFSDIFVIDTHDDKTKYIKDDSIFIDDSYAERKQVSENLNIPVFDLDMIYGLINYKK